MKVRWINLNKIFEEWHAKNHSLLPYLQIEAIRAAFKDGYELGRNDQAAEDEDNLSERAVELSADREESMRGAMD